MFTANQCSCQFCVSFDVFIPLQDISATNSTDMPYVNSIVIVSLFLTFILFLRLLFSCQKMLRRYYMMEYRRRYIYMIQIVNSNLFIPLSLKNFHVFLLNTCSAGVSIWSGFINTRYIILGDHQHGEIRHILTNYSTYPRIWQAYGTAEQTFNIPPQVYRWSRSHDDVNLSDDVISKLVFNR